MDTVLLVGLVVGTGIGLLHAGYVFRSRLGDVPAARRRQPLGTTLRAAYHALWTLLLWVVFGSYVLFMWVISLVAYAAYVGGRRLKRGGHASGRLSG